MKLVVQVPCHNEAEHIGITLSALPRALPGISEIEWLVIDDGSIDGTAEVARRFGVDHVVQLKEHRGLSRAFIAGLEASLRGGADIIVNTDADNQYCADDIAGLIAPIVRGEADVVVGLRPIAEMTNFSATKKWLQHLGSRVVRWLSGVRIADATSGFRAFSREAALQLDVFSTYTYTLETLIQAGQIGLAVRGVTVRVNAPLRESRLSSNTAHYVWRAVLSLVRSVVIYRPFRFFAIPAGASLAVGLLVAAHAVYRYSENGVSDLQSLVLASIFLMFAAILATIALAADLLAINRRLLQTIQADERRRKWRPQ